MKHLTLNEIGTILDCIKEFQSLRELAADVDEKLSLEMRTSYSGVVSFGIISYCPTIHVDTIDLWSNAMLEIHGRIAERANLLKKQKEKLLQTHEKEVLLFLAVICDVSTSFYLF